MQPNGWHQAFGAALACLVYLSRCVRPWLLSNVRPEDEGAEQAQDRNFVKFHLDRRKWASLSR